MCEVLNAKQVSWMYSVSKIRVHFIDRNLLKRNKAENLKNTYNDK